MDRFKYFVSKFKGNVLNIGCFDSSLYEKMFETGYGQLKGLDIVVGDRKRGITRGNALEMNYENEFDLIIAGELIEHFFLRETKNFLQRCHKALKSGGRLVVSTPNKLAWSNRLFHRFDNAAPEMYSRHIYLFRVRELEYLLDDNGFVVEESFCLPYTEESSPGHHAIVYFVRGFIHHFLPKGLQEQIVICARVKQKVEE